MKRFITWPESIDSLEVEISVNGTNVERVGKYYQRSGITTIPVPDI